MRRAMLWLILGSGALPSACVVAEQFACAADDQCMIGEIAGRCEPGGVCSFPDADCPSGHRYGELSGELAGECVEVGTGSATDDGTTSDPSPQTEGADGSDTGTSSTTSTSTSTPTDPSTSTGPSTSTSTTSDDTSSSTTGPDPDPYGPCMEDSDCPLPDSVCFENQNGPSVCIPPCEADPCPTSDRVNDMPACLPVGSGVNGCVLLCELQDCPEGMQCEPVGPETFGICMWP